MSLGYGGGCSKYGENNEYVIYEYFAFDWNIKKYQNEYQIMDGLIKIEKSSFIEPDIHHRVIRRPGHRKKVIIKRIVKPVPCEEFLKRGIVELINSSYCSKINSDGYGRIGMELIEEIYRHYQIEGKIPHRINVIY